MESAVDVDDTVELTPPECARGAEGAGALLGLIGFPPLASSDSLMEAKRSWIPPRAAPTCAINTFNGTAWGVNDPSDDPPPPPPPPLPPRPPSPFPRTRTSNVSPVLPVLYLQQSLTKGIGDDLIRDFQAFHWSWLAEMKKVLRFGGLTTNLLLIGQDGCVTPSHYDKQENFFAQVR